MSNEQNGPGTDPLVSETYRALADEKTPEALNREVLRMAAKKGRTRFAIARAWTRPLAWAATIALSLTLVLQLTDTPQPASVPVGRPADQNAAETGAAVREGIGVRDTPASLPASADRLEPGRDAAPEPSSVLKRSRTDMQQQSAKVEVVNDSAAPIIEETTGAKDDTGTGLASQALAPTDVREYAEETAREELVAEQDTGSDAVSRSRQMERRLVERPAAGVAAMTSMAVTDDAATDEFLCPPRMRESAEKWLECITSIEEEAPAELVEREYEALRTSYPEFERPAR